MSTLTQQWEEASDRRAIFLGCYTLMTRNMLAAIDAGRFHDGEWVGRLLRRFVDYYFDALTLYDQASTDTPPVWKLTHDATHQDHVMTLQHLLLGINAHINNDLVFALYDLLAPEWAGLSEAGREQRHTDHTLVNHIIGETVDSVQDQVIDRHAPWFKVIDKLMGPTDEWLTSHLIAHWREEVWDKAVRYLTLADAHERDTFHQKIGLAALRRGEEILGEVL
jgi:hypothetical protein